MSQASANTLEQAPEKDVNRRWAAVSDQYVVLLCPGLLF